MLFYMGTFMHTYGCMHALMQACFHASTLHACMHAYTCKIVYTVGVSRASARHINVEHMYIHVYVYAVGVSRACKR